MSKTILITDDFKNTRHVVRMILEKNGYTILEAENGKDALRYFNGDTIDLLITDYNMPEMNGLELVKAVKKIRNYRFIPIFLLTTETDEKKKREVLNTGITGWIRKPFNFDDFSKKVERVLR